MSQVKKVYFVGGGIGSLTAAAFLIRDAKVDGSQISIFDNQSAYGGALDACGDSVKGYSFRGGRMFTTDNYECLWDLFKTIPALNDSFTVNEANPKSWPFDPVQRSCYHDMLEFSAAHSTDSHARLVDSRCHRLDCTKMGFDMQDRLDLLRLTAASEESLGKSPITDHLNPHFFTTNFWYMWQTTFAFQPWHSAVEFKRYLLRFILEFPRIYNLAGVRRTRFNQFDSLVRPLLAWLKQQNVNFINHTRITDVSHHIGSDGKMSLTSLHLTRTDGQSQSEPVIAVNEGDLVFIQNGSMTDGSSIGSMTEAPAKLGRESCLSFSIWEKLAALSSDFGRPSAFTDNIPHSQWYSFTVTLNDGGAFFSRMYEFSCNEPGSGGLVTFKDSNWLMSIVLMHQPHFPNQSSTTQVFWGYALNVDRIGNFVAKSMMDCCGEEIMTELLGHLKFDVSLDKIICLPCRMPMITSMFAVRNKSDRPLPVPLISKNFGFISQFVEIEDDVVFTVEYSVRAAQTAVYQLCHIDKTIPPVHHYQDQFNTKIHSLVQAFQ